MTRGDSRKRKARHMNYVQCCVQYTVLDQHLRVCAPFLIHFSFRMRWMCQNGSGCLVLSDGFDVMTGEKRDFESLFSSAFRLFAGCLEEGDKKNWLNKYRDILRRQRRAGERWNGKNRKNLILRPKIEINRWRCYSSDAWHILHTRFNTWFHLLLLRLHTLWRMKRLEMITRNQAHKCEANEYHVRW